MFCQNTRNRPLCSPADHVAHGVVGVLRRVAQARGVFYEPGERIVLVSVLRAVRVEDSGEVAERVIDDLRDLTEGVGHGHCAGSD